MRPGGDGSAALDAEDILDRHEERLVRLARRGRDVAVDRVHQLLDRGVVLALGVVAAGLERLERRAADDGDVVAGELVLAEELADLHLDEVDEHLVVDHVDLVEVHDQARDLDLASQEDVLASLRHRTVSGGHDQDRAVHLGGAGDHVLDVVGVTGAVNVSVVTVGRLVLDVADGDRDAALPLLGSVVDLVEGAEVSAAGQRQELRDRCGQRRLAVVDVPDRADIDVRLAAVELLLGHVGPSSLLECLCLALRLCDQLVGEVARDFCIAAELHRVGGTTLGHAPQLGGVAEHLGQGDV